MLTKGFNFTINVGAAKPRYISTHLVHAVNSSTIKTISERYLTYTLNLPSYVTELTIPLFVNIKLLVIDFIYSELWPRNFSFTVEIHTRIECSDPLQLLHSEIV